MLLQAGTRCLPERVLRNAYDSPNTFAVHRGKDWAGGSMHYVDLLNRFGERLGFYELLRMLGAPGLGDKEELAAAQDREDQGESKSAGDNAAAAAAANSALHSVPLAERLRYQGDDSGAFAGLLPPPDKAAAEKCQKQQAILVQLLGNEDPSSSSSLGMARPLTAEQLPYEPAGRMAVPHASTLSNVSQIGMLLEVVRAMANMLALPFSRRLVTAVLKHVPPCLWKVLGHKPALRNVTVESIQDLFQRWVLCCCPVLHTPMRHRPLLPPYSPLSTLPLSGTFVPKRCQTFGGGRHCCGFAVRLGVDP